MAPKQASTAPHRARVRDEASIRLVCTGLLTMTIVTHPWAAGRLGEVSKAFPVFEERLPAGQVPYILGDGPVGPYLVENDVGPRPTELLDVSGPYGRAQHHDPDARAPASQLAEELLAVPVGQGQVEHRHVQSPLEAFPFERLPGLGQGSRLGDHFKLRIIREQDGEGLAEGGVVLQQHDFEWRGRAHGVPE